MRQKVSVTSLEEDRHLVGRAQQGDREAFETLARRYEGRLEALIRSRIASHVRIEAEEVYQEAVLRGYESVRDFKWQGEDSFLRWLGGIAEYVILNLARRHARDKRVPLSPELTASGVSPSRGVRRAERFERLQRAFDHLSPDHRTVLQLAHIDGLRLREIAQRMERSPEAVRKLLWRALKELRARFPETESFRLPARRLKNDGAMDDEQEPA